MADINNFLAKPLNMIVATKGANGYPQLSPVWFYWDGEALYFSTTTDRVKYKNIARDPHMSLIIDDEQEHMYVAVYGEATIMKDNFSDIAKKILGKYVSAEQQEKWQQMFEAPERVVIKIKPSKLITHG